MKKLVPFLGRVIALLTVTIFMWDQIVFAAGVNPFEPYQAQSVQPTTDKVSAGTDVNPPPTVTDTTTDFLLNKTSPLSPAQSASEQTDSNKTYDENGKLRKEILLDGTAILHVYEGERVQSAIDQAQSGDTVYLHIGTYDEHLTLKSGVNLNGEDAERTIINGGNKAQSNIISALGNNRVEALTITGGGPYAGFPASAIRVQGDNVKIRNNRFIDNQDYGIHCWSGTNILIEGNFFRNNNLAIQLPKAGTTIRYNTFVSNGIAINILSGGTPLVENNVFTDSTFQSIYEFCWGRTPSLGYATVRSNTFFNNVEHGSYYGSATPPAAAEKRDGNLLADPQFVNATTGDYNIKTTAASYGRGAFLPKGLANALDRISYLDANYSIAPISDGQVITGYRVLYEEGSEEEFYNDGRQILDTTSPLIVFSSPVLTRDSNYTLTYTEDGIEKTQVKPLVDGDNVLTVTAKDIFGNIASSSLHVLLDQTSPSGSILINHGAVYATSQHAVLDLSRVSDALSGPDKMRFSLDGGVTWTGFEDFSAIKAFTLPDGNGTKEVRAEVTDKAGNKSSFSSSIQLVPEVVVNFTSSPETSDADYLLSYTVNGTAQSEHWQLSSGLNSLLVRVPGDPSTFERFNVTLTQPDIAVPAMPLLPSLEVGLVSMTTQNGLVIKYSGSSVVSVENPGVYQLFLPQFDASGNLTAGVLLFANGDKLLYQDSKPVLKISVSGEKTVYNNSGRADSVIDPHGTRIWFSYRVDHQGSILSLLARESSATSLYEGGVPSRIVMQDGSDIRYEQGVLSSYRDASGNIFQYQITERQSSGVITGHTSTLFAVTPAGTSDAIALSQISADLSQYPTIQSSLENKISTEIVYDAGLKMLQFTSGKGEVLTLNNQLPQSMRDGAGNLKLFQNTLGALGQLSSISFTGSNAPAQSFDAAGNIRTMTIGDGTVFQIASNTLDAMTLTDGSVLTGLKWDAETQIMTDYVRNYSDGTKVTYVNSHLVRKEETNGNITTYIASGDGSDKPDLLKTADGRTYHFMEYPNAQGLLDRTTELVSIDLVDGGRVEFEHGIPVRYIHGTSALVDPVDFPELEDGKYFVPQIDLENAQLRALTVDESGAIFSGQILFRDGTQYLIENGKVTKQVTALGQIIEVSNVTLPPVQIPASLPVEPLTTAETAYRNQLVEMQLDYFMNGKGIHAGTGLPVDNFAGSSNQQADYSQATLVGFWAEILASIAAGDYTTVKISRQQAFEKLKSLLDTYREVQRQVGWNGIVAFFRIVETQEPILDDSGDPTGQTRTVYQYENSFNEYGFGDALNLAVSLSSVIGALENLSLDPAFASYRSQIVSSANEILVAQEPGYAAFYDPAIRRFHGTYGLDTETGEWRFIGNNDYTDYIDRVFNEFRTGMIWLAAKYPPYREAVGNLEVTIRSYQTLQGDNLDMATPFDGGAFQMFWPLIHVDETQYPEFQTALRNFLYAQAEFVNANNIPGLLSAGDVPLEGHHAKIGLPGAAETDDPLRMDTGSIYGTAAAFSVAPHYTLQFLKNLESLFPGMRTSAGFVDAIRLQTVTQQDPETGETTAATTPVYSDQYYGVDQASFILSLLKTSQNYFKNYLAGTGAQSTFEAIYQGLSFKLNPSGKANPTSPVFDQSVTRLYDGLSTIPDGLSTGLIRQTAFIPIIIDPEWGEGHVYNYLTAAGEVHHVEIEFGEGESLRRINLQEYCLMSGQGGIATALLAGFKRDILNSATNSGDFYTAGSGFANTMLATDPAIGQAWHMNFDFQSASEAVGHWVNFNSQDLSGYDFLTVPVKLAAGTPQNVRLKFELKGVGEVFLTGPLTQDWQYVSIPIPDLSGALTQFTVSVQSLDGNPVAGDLVWGPLSAMKVRTSNDINWALLLEKTDAEIRALIRQKIISQINGDGGLTARETLENFVIDSSGKLVSGTLKRADGGIQYFQGGQIVKWIFRNGRTILFEKGLATFVIDLARGKLETERFYYDQGFNGDIHSFVVQGNDQKTVFDAQGHLKTLASAGYSINFTEGAMSSIQTEKATLTNLVFADDGSLRNAHVALAGGSSFEIVGGLAQGVDMGGGVKIFSDGFRISAIETPQNGRTDFLYDPDVTSDQLERVDARFTEVVVDPQTGNSVSAIRTLSLSEYLQRPERAIEKTHILKESPVNVIQKADLVGGFSTDTLPAGEITAGYSGSEASAIYRFCYQNANEGPILGMFIKNATHPVHVENYNFLTLTLKKDPSMNWNQTFKLTLKTAGYEVLYNFQVDATAGDYQTFQFPLTGKVGAESEVTLEVLRQADGVGRTGMIYIRDLSYLALQKTGRSLWEEKTGVAANQLRSLWIGAKQFGFVGAEIVSRQAQSYSALAGFFNMPTLLHYRGTSTGDTELVGFNQFDGAQVELQGQNVNRVILSDGTVNEYSSEGNASESTIQAPGGSNKEVGSLNYHYGELRKITQSDGKVYELSYEFDASGNEITMIKDVLTGDIRRFKDGKIFQSTTAVGVSTAYNYQNGELAGAELFYKNHVLQSSSYKFVGDETQVTDASGTTWYYDANGNLIKHLTKEGYLYTYSDYSSTLQGAQALARDYKWDNIFSATDLRAVSWVGYETRDGMQIKKGDDGLWEIVSPSGDKAVNLVFDDERKIQSGQIQFANGLILEIENYLPVRGRLADGALFSTNFPEGSTQTTLIQDGTGAYTGSMFQNNGTYYNYDAYGYLTKISSPTGESYQFSYQRDASGNATGYDVLHRKQVDFNGVPFPEEMAFEAGTNLVLKGHDEVISQRDGNTGFLISKYDEALNQWTVLSGQFSSDGDRILLRNFLRDLKAGQYVAMMANDPNFSQAGEEILARLEGIGANQVRAASASNQAWYLFGNECLNKGQGYEKTGGNSFSTVTESITHTNLEGVNNPVFNSMNLILSAPKAVAEAYSVFLKTYEINKPADDLEKTTVYNNQNQIVYSESLNGVQTFYNEGKPRETYTSDGELLYVHEYGCPEGGCSDPKDPFLIKVTLAKARLDFEAEAAKSRQQIEQVKFDALRQLAEQEDVAQANIKQEVANSIAALDTYIGQLQAQRYQRVKQCKTIIFWKSCSEKTYEVPGIADMISEAQNQKVALLQNIGPEQIATIPALIEQKKLEIEAAITQRMSDLAAQEQAVFHDVLQREVAPVLADIYRRLLGRDPSTEEVDAEITRFGTTQAIDLNRTVSEIKSSAEFQNRTSDKAAIISQVRTFLNNYFAAVNDPEARAQLVQSIQLNPSEVVDLNQEEITAIMSWLESRDLHFGQSAFLSLKNLLISRGIDVPMVTLGYEAILADILTGTINRFTEGDLLISVFALNRVAKIHGADTTGVKYALEDLKVLYASACPALLTDKTASCGLRVIAHVGGNHFVVITAVTADSVTFLETNKGPTGGLITETFDQFMKTWDAGNGAGHLVAYKDQAITAKTIDDQKAMRVRGAFFGLDDLIFWFTVASLVLTSASIVVSYISPTFGRILGYAAMVAGIVAIAASVVNFAVQGFTMALNATKGLTLLQSIQKGFSALGSAIWDGVAHVGQFLKQGFTFFSDVFTGNFGSLGAGITNLGKFAMDGVKVMFDSAGALVKQNLTFGQMVGRSMIAAAINIPVSKGLEGLGIDPRMARLAGAFISGGVVGLGGGTTQFFQSGMQMYLLQGVSEIGLNLDLPPPVTAALSIAVNASLAGFFDPNFILRNELPNIFPSFTQQLTLGGIDLLGRSLGLDPRITELIGLPFAAAIGGVTKDLLNPNGGMTSLWQSIQNAVFSRETIGGVLSIGAGFTIDAFSLDESLTSSFLSRLSVGLLKDFIQTGGRTNVFESLTANAQKSLRHFLDPNILPQLFAAVSEKGLATAFEEYAISVLRQDTIEDFSEGGLSFAQQITLAMQNAQDSNCGGRPCRSIHIGKNDKLITYEYFYENGKFQIYGVQEIVDGFDREFVFETDSNGNITGVMVLVRDDQGQVITERKLTGDVRDTIQFTDWNGDVYAEISISETGEFEFANYNLGVSGDISRYGQVELSYQIPDLEEDFGGLIQQFNATNLTPAQKRQVVCFSVGNGFWNQHRSKDEISDLAKALLQNLTGDLARNGTPPAILYENGHIAVDGGGNILTTASLPITLYEETGLIGNGLKWMCETWFGCNDMKEEIVSEVTHYMDVLRANGFDPSQMNLVHFSHSGNFQPMIKALEDPRLAELNLKTMIVYGGPYAGDGVINNTNLDTIIRIHGSKDSVPLLGDRQFSGVDSAGNLRPVTNYNIEILDAGHSDFSCASGPNSDACSDFINQQTNLFTRDLELIANDRDFLARFLSEETVGIKIENGLIKLDPRKYISPFGERQ